MPYPHRKECMKKMRFVFLALFVALTGSLQAQEKAPLKLVETIPLPGLKDGDFDHFAPDVDGHRLFLTAEENGKVQVYDSDSYQAVGEIKVSIDADSIAYDPATNYLYVVNGGREAHTPYSLISVIDTNNSKRLRDIKINSNHVEAIVLEKSGPRMFCNITGQNAVGVLDRNESALAATWRLPPGDTQNVAMALDEANHGLFVVTRKPGKLMVLNSENGKVIADLPAVGLVDDLSYDAKQKRLYLAGDQSLDVFDQKDHDHYVLLARIPGSFRAETGILVPELNRYYLAVPHHENKDAQVRVYEIQP